MGDDICCTKLLAWPMPIVGCTNYRTGFPSNVDAVLKMAGGKARVSRKSTKGSGKRWAKGQSSSSNPTTEKHRELAKTKFFQYGSGNAALTLNALAKHNAVDGSPFLQQDDAFSIGGKTIDTQATGWTQCTNPSFNRLLKRWEPSSANHNAMLAVLAAVTEVIKHQGGKETDTEYFAALMTSLEAVENNAEVLSACITLIGIVIKRLPMPVLKVKFSEASKVFFHLLVQHRNSNEPRLINCLIGCLSVFLRAQESAIWGNSSTIQIYLAILNFVIDCQPKIRKASQHAVCAILKGSAIMLTENAPTYHPAAPETAKFCVKELEECRDSGGAVTLYVLNLLKNILSSFSRNHVKICCEAILRLLTLGNLLVTSSSLQVLHGMFINRPNVKNLNLELNAQIITALYDFQPPINDAQPLLAWLAVIQEAHLNLFRMNPIICLQHVAYFFTNCTKIWLSEKTAVTAALSSTLKCFLYGCLQNHADSKIPGKIFTSVANCLTFEYHAVWKHVIHVIAVLYEILGGKHHSIMKQSVVALAELRESEEFAYINEVDHALGKAVRFMGPKAVLEALPLRFSSKEDEWDFPRSWLLPVIRDNVSNTELSFFTNYLLPVANGLAKTSLQCCKDGRMARSKTYDLIQQQIWSMLPGFCNNPTDLSQSFKGIAKALGTALTESAEISLEILAALRTLISKNFDNDTNKSELTKFAKNYLPILFNMYIKRDKELGNKLRLAVFDTIKIYLEITPPALCLTLFDKAFEKLDDKELIPHVRFSVLDLTQALLPFIDDSRLSKLYEASISNIESMDRMLQKKTYTIVKEMCAAKSESCERFIRNSLERLLNSLINSMSSVVPSSKASRLHCLSLLFKRISQDKMDIMLTVVPEAILCTKESSIKARTVAASLLVEICQKLLDWGGKPAHDIFKDYVMVVFAGLAGSLHMIGASVLALSMLVSQFKTLVSSDLLSKLVEGISLLMAMKSRNVIISALVFVKTLLTNFSDVDLIRHLQVLVKCLTTMKEDCQKHFRVKVKHIYIRLIKKFSFQEVLKFTPQKFGKMLSNIKKQQERHKRKMSQVDKRFKEGSENYEISSKPQTIHELLKVSDGDSDEGEHSTDMHVEGRKKKENAAWLKEGEDIVDLLDRKYAQNVLASKPGAIRKVSHDDFKIAPDGRLIIDDSDSKPQQRITSKQHIDITANDMLDMIAGPSKKRHYEESDDDDSPKKYQAGGTGIHRPIPASYKSDVDTRTGKSATFGADLYRAKKAGGDVKFFGKPDPYAYVPLDTQALNRRRRAKFKGQFKGIISAAKKGAATGARNRKSKNSHTRY